MNGCSHDSLWTICLSEVKIAPLSGAGDPVYNFYRPNKSFTTEEILSRLPALSMTRRSNFGQEPGIRGLSGSRINVTLDGMKMFGACTDKMDPVTIYVEPQNLESFEVGSGACGSEHGSSLGGSLDMKLKDPDFNDEKTVHGMFGMTLHSIANSVFTFGGIDLSDKRWAVKVNGAYRKSQNYKAGGGEVVQFSTYEKNNISVSAKYLLSAQQTLKIDLLTDNGFKIGFPALSMDVRDAHARIGSLSWSYRTNESFIREAEVKIYTNTIRHMMDDRDRQGLVIHMDMPGNSITSGTDAGVRMSFSKKINLFTKIDYYSNTLLAEMFMYPEGGAIMYMRTLPETRRDVGGIYVSPVWKPDSLNTITLGARWDLSYTEMKDPLGLSQAAIFYPIIDSSYYRNVRSSFLDFEHTLTKRIVAGIQLGWSERLPSSQEMFGFYLYNRLDGYDYLGQPALKNETSIQYSLLLRYEYDQWNLSLSPFITKINDYIEGEKKPEYSAMTQGANGVKAYRNNGSAVLKGGELIVKYNQAGSLSMISSGKFIYGEKENKQAMWQIPPFKSVTSLRYRKGLFSVQSEVELSAAQNHIDVESGETRTPSYIIFHIRFSASRMFGSKSLEFNGGVENITDRYYHEHLDWRGVPRPGRNIYMTLAFRF